MTSDNDDTPKQPQRDSGDETDCGNDPLPKGMRVHKIDLDTDADPATKARQIADAAMTVARGLVHATDGDQCSTMGTVAMRALKDMLDNGHGHCAAGAACQFLVNADLMTEAEANAIYDKASAKQDEADKAGAETADNVIPFPKKERLN